MARRARPIQLPQRIPPLHLLLTRRSQLRRRLLALLAAGRGGEGAGDGVRMRRTSVYSAYMFVNCPREPERSEIPLLPKSAVLAEDMSADASCNEQRLSSFYTLPHHAASTGLSTGTFP